MHARINGTTVAVQAWIFGVHMPRISFSWNDTSYLMCSPLLLGLHFRQEPTAHHLHARVPPASLGTPSSVRALPRLVYWVGGPQLLWTFRAAAVVCGLWTGGWISAGWKGQVGKFEMQRIISGILRLHPKSCSTNEPNPNKRPITVTYEWQFMKVKKNYRRETLIG